MSVIDRVKEHFESQGVKKINVAEWGEEGQPLVIYSTPMSLAEKRNLFKSAKDNDLGIMVDVIALKSRDKDGNKIFKLDDKQTLMNKADPEVIARVAGEILNSISLEDAEKKVRSDQELYSILALGEKLHKSMEEVLAMTEKEFIYWIAYFKVKADKEKLHGTRTSPNSLRRS